MDQKEAREARRKLVVDQKEARDSSGPQLELRIYPVNIHIKNYRKVRGFSSIEDILKDLRQPDWKKIYFY